MTKKFQGTVLIENYVAFPQSLLQAAVCITLSLVKQESSQCSPQISVGDLTADCHNLLPSANPEVSWKAPNQTLAMNASTSVANGLLVFVFFSFNLIPVWLYF